MMYHTPQSGFSLVETFVAITILLIVIVGPMTIITSTSNGTSFANEQVIAFFLAQEGAELAQKARDDYVLDYFDGGSGDWSAFADTSGDFAACFDDGCGLQNINGNANGLVHDGSNPVVDCDTESDCDLYFNTSDVRSRYTHDPVGAENTSFRRIITFDDSESDQIRVISEVSWFPPGTRNPHVVSVETVLFNIYELP